MITARFHDIERTLISNIKNAKSSVKIAVAWFLNPNLFALIRNLIDNGIKVEIILCDDITNFDNKFFSFQELIDNNAEVRISKYPNLMHHKFCIIDNKLLLTGSYNWTVSAEKNNYENIIITNELLIVEQFIDEFNQLKRATKLIKSISATSFHNYEFIKDEDFENYKDLSAIESNPVIEYDNNIETISDENKLLLNKADRLYRDLKHQPAIDLCNKIIATQSNIPDVYELIASAKWRQKKYLEMVKYAAKAIDLDNTFIEAYNLIAIGYGHLKNSQKALENYQICIEALPSDYVLYRNRGLSYLDLATEVGLPKKFRDNFLTKATSDFLKVISLTNELISDVNNYPPFVCRGVAFFHLEKYYDAKITFEKALKAYAITEKDNRDVHDIQDIKTYQKDIQALLSL